jgi:hypothetical protein
VAQAVAVETAHSRVKEPQVQAVLEEILAEVQDLQVVAVPHQQHHHQVLTLQEQQVVAVAVVAVAVMVALVATELLDKLFFIGRVN